MESRLSGNSVKSYEGEVEFSSDCQKCLQDEKISGASQKEGLGDRQTDDLAVPHNSAALPSDNAGSVEYDEVVLPQATESVIDYDQSVNCPLNSDGVLTSDDSTEQGAAPPSVVDNYAVAPPVPSLRDSRAPDRLSHILDTVDDRVKMDDFSYVHELSDSIYEAFSDSEDEVISPETGTPNIVYVDASAASGATQMQIDDRKIGNNFQSQMVDFTETAETADLSGPRPRRAIRRPRKYDGFETQFTR